MPVSILKVYLNLNYNYLLLLIIIFKIQFNLAYLLEQIAKAKEITGGGIKTFVKTCWTTIYDCASFVINLEPVLQEVIIYLFNTF
jgi:hypothetical protein